MEPKYKVVKKRKGNQGFSISITECNNCPFAARTFLTRYHCEELSVTVKYPYADFRKVPLSGIWENCPFYSAKCND